MDDLTILQVAYHMITKGINIFGDLLLVFVIGGAFVLILKSFRNIVTGRKF